MTERLKIVAENVQDCMDEILSNFKPGALITVLVRRPGDPEQDFCMTSDDLTEVAIMVTRSQSRPDLSLSEKHQDAAD